MNGLGAGLVGVAVPVGLIWLKLGIAFTRMAQRKRSNTKFAFIGAFPLWALPFGLWLMMRSDAPTPAEENSSDDAVDPLAAEAPIGDSAVGPVAGAVGPLPD